jgi:hypothetical protein
MTDNLFDEHGYLITEILKERRLTYEEAKSIMADEIQKNTLEIERLEAEISKLKSYRSCMEYSFRTMWLLFKNEEEG